MGIDPKLREYHHMVWKPIVFTKDMIQKVFNLPAGATPVAYLKKGDHSDLRNSYRDGDLPTSRAPIALTEGMLKNCADDDVVMINRTFSLLSFATVLFPGTSNMFPLDYLGSLLHMDRVHEYDWPEEVLKLIYVEHLDFPLLGLEEHVIDYSLPRACHVCKENFELAVAIDKNKITLTANVFGKRPIQDLCNTPYVIAPVHGAAEQPAPHVQDYLNISSQNASGSFAETCATLADWLQGSFPSSQDLGVPPQFKDLYEKHKGLFEVDLKGALSSIGRAVQSIQCRRMALLLKDANSAATGDDVHETTDQTTDNDFSLGVHIHDTTAQEEASIGVYNPQPNGGSDSLKEPVKCTEEPTDTGVIAMYQLAEILLRGIKLMNLLVVTLLWLPTRRAAAELMSKPCKFCPVSTFPFVTSEHRDASTLQGSSKHMLMHKRVAKDFETVPKMKRLKIAPDCDALYTKYVLHKQRIKKPKQGESYPPFIKIGGFYTSYPCWQGTCKKFAFSCVTTDQLSVDPTKFKPKTCMAQLRRACKKGKAAKADLRDIASFVRVDIAEYPHQATYYDCGFFAMLYMENFDGKIMKHFEQSCVTMHRKVVASDLFLHPENEIDSVTALAEQAP
ncbi:unnamed protein product [Alopecurus aequalis]